MTIDALLRVKRARNAPHKPLVLLAALDLYGRGRPRLIPFRDLSERFGQLAHALQNGHTIRIQEPFRRLTNDGVWEITAGQAGANDLAGGLATELFNSITIGDAPEIMRSIVEHYFSPDDQAALRAALDL